MLRRMQSIEYNAFMSIMKFLNDNIGTLVTEYGYNIGREIEIKPSYPRDLSKLFKPSIIVRKVDISQYKLGIGGGYIGQHYDKSSNTRTDVYGILHCIEYQFDTCCESNTQMFIVESLIHDLFNNISCTGARFPLYDFTADANNPVEMGHMTIMRAPLSTPLMSDNTNNDYISSTRITFSIVQTIVPKQEYVDLSKWIKQSFKIKIS